MAITWIYAFTSVFCFCSFGWSIKSEFRKIENQHRLGYFLLKLANVVVWLYSLWYFVFQAQSSADQILTFLGIATNISSASLFYWARRTAKKRLSLAFSMDIPNVIITSGPYYYVRHPFYMSYILCYFGLAVNIWQFPMFILFAFNCIIYVWAARIEENKFANSSLSLDFQLYRKRTGMFIPLLKRQNQLNNAR